uniref:uncharacterized protein LOC120342661 n=1 Tax=Styela clava TaxID=7725 RepID=UPI001939FE6F|nr:uncharacterized protein LOC120342661 [Styela clava]
MRVIEVLTMTIGCVLLLRMSESEASPLKRGHVAGHDAKKPSHMVREQAILKALHHLVRQESNPTVRHEISHFLARMRKLRSRRHVDGLFSAISGKAYDEEYTRVFIRSLKQRYFERQRECYNAILVFADQPELFKAALEQCG